MRFATTLLLILMISACSEETESWKNQRKPDYQGELISVPESQLRLPIRIPLDEVQEALNRRIPNHLVKQKRIKAGLVIDIHRGGAVLLSGESHQLNWSLPLAISITHTLVKGELSSFKLKPEFSSELQVNDNYGLSSETKLTKLEWLTPATIRVLGEDIDLSKAIENLIRDEEQKITTLIDQELGKLDFRQILGRTWNKLTNPIRINRKLQPIYMMVEPSELKLISYDFLNNSLAVSLGVKGQLETVYDSVANIRENAPYPTLIQEGESEFDSQIYLPLIADYVLINNHLKNEVWGTEFTVEDQLIRIDSVAVTNVDSLLLITTKVSGDVPLEVEFLGRPKYIAYEKTLTVSDFDYQVLRSEFSLLHFGDYFFHEEIIDALKDRLNLKIGSLVDTIPHLIYRGVERGKSGDKINLHTAVDTISLHQLCINPNDISLVLFAKGEAMVEVEKIKPRSMNDE